MVLVTGASGGIGEATAHRLAARGADLILLARRKGELERVAQDIREQFGCEARILPADITAPEDRERVRREVGTLHVLVNNAGITAHGRFADMDLAVLRRSVEINFFSMAELTQALLPAMRRTEGRKAILLVSTPSGLYGIPERSAYSAGKAAGHALMESLRSELLEDDIRTTLFCPGYTRTNLRTSGLSADGGTLHEEQAKSAKDPEFVAEKLCRALEKEKRIAFTDFNGHAVYWLRMFAPGILERAALRKRGN